MITAYANLLIAWTGYLFQGRKSKSGTTMEVHELDQQFLDWLWSWRSLPPILPEDKQKIIERVTLLLSDQILVTGIAVLATGYIKSCDMSIYHFEILTWLGWLASNGHQITLTSLQHYLRDNRIVLWYRILAMSVVVLLLIPAIVLAGVSASASVSIVFSADNEGTLYPFDTPARCGWTPSAVEHLSPDTVFATCVLGFGIVSRIIRLFDKSSNTIECWLRRMPSKWLQKSGAKWRGRVHASRNPRSRTWWKIATGSVITVYVFGKATYDCIGSTLNQLMWLTFSLLYGTSKIFSWRGMTERAPGLALAEYEWTFGQIIPLLMLIQPLMAIPELFSGPPCFPSYVDPSG
jgi:hypothetical protein